MSLRTRGIVLASLSVSLLTLAACGTTSGVSNMSDRSGASRVDSILERAAREASAAGNKAEALVILEQLHAKNPKDAGIATAYGQSLREDDQLNRARQVLVPFTEGKDAYPDAVIELSMVQLALGQYKEAELTARNAVKLDPESGRGYLALGTALDAQNYHEQAEVAFRRGVEKWKGDPAPIMNNLALNLASQNKLDPALDMLKRAKEISPNRIEIERNIRIITTLKESADDFVIKQEEEARAAAAPKAAPKPAVPKAAAAKAPEAKTTKVVTEQKPAAKAKTAVKKSETKPEKIEPAAAAPAAADKTSAPVRKQNFNKAVNE